jgi:hypothetical protein
LTPDEPAAEPEQLLADAAALSAQNAAAAQDGGAPAEVAVGATATALAPAQAADASAAPPPAVSAPPSAAGTAPPLPAATTPPAAAASAAAPPPAGYASPPTPAGAGSRFPWTAVGLSALAVVVVAGIVAAVLIAAGGSPSSSSQTSNVAAQKVQLTNALLASRDLYTTSQQASYSALLPAGWQPIATTNPLLSDAATVQSPLDTGTTMTVARLAKPAKTLSGNAAQVLRALSGASGFANQLSEATTLAGGRGAWAIGYSAGGSSVAYYLVQSCKNTYAVSATVPSSRASIIRPRLQVVAGTLQGNC